MDLLAGSLMSELAYSNEFPGASLDVFGYCALHSDELWHASSCRCDKGLGDVFAVGGLGMRA